MKKEIAATTIGMACGAGVTAYFLTNKKAKKKADKLLNNMMNEANKMINKMN